MPTSNQDACGQKMEGRGNSLLEDLIFAILASLEKLHEEGWWLQLAGVGWGGGGGVGGGAIGVRDWEKVA